MPRHVVQVKFRPHSTLTDSTLFILGIEITFLYLNMILQTNQTGVAGWEGFRVPERYNCITSQHVRFFNLTRLYVLTNG